MLEKYDRGASKDVNKIVTGDDSWIYAYEHQTKQKSACFFCKTAPVATVPIEHRMMVNFEWYTTICLPKVFREIRNTNRRKRIIVHHANTSSHTSSQINDLLTGQNVE